MNIRIIYFLLFAVFISFDVAAQIDYTIDMGGTVSTCSGNFYDPGGPAGNYGNSDFYTMTFCSDTPGEEIVFNFISWDLEACCDYLTIYDGSGTGGTQLYYGNGGNASPGIISSNSGCLTFVWDSDGSFTYSGWEATISCITPSCTDGIQNQGETGVDCGGPCGPCIDFTVDMGGTVNTCVGNFFDPGGATGNYGSNDLYTMTFCSDTPGEQIVFDFLTFDVESGWDDLVIYDGSNTSSPVIGTFTGTNGPGTVESTNGCLTFVWDSDGSVNYSGWAASISCYAPSCSDGIQNQGETGIDCGGPCAPCPSCTDGIQNGDETGVDCGGSCPEPCHCGNGILDGDETDVDCGGSCYPCPIECSVDLTYELDGSGSMVFPGGVDYLISNGTINTCGGTFFDIRC